MSLSKKDLIAFWSTDTFLNQYLQRLKFDEPYAKAYGSIALGWVTNTWHKHINAIALKYTKTYLNRYKKLPKGQHILKVEWKKKKPKWLVDCLKSEQLITFPRVKGGHID
jgi:hypothetical protein